ncbi:hypothetical protein F4703DRAFT_1827702 [Phycomyces blakesleeanus]
MCIILLIYLLHTVFRIQKRKKNEKKNYKNLLLISKILFIINIYIIIAIFLTASSILPTKGFQFSLPTLFIIYIYQTRSTKIQFNSLLPMMFTM